MSTPTALIQAAQNRLKELDDERAELLALLKRHGVSVPVSAPSTNGHRAPHAAAKKTAAKHTAKKSQNHKAAEPREHASPPKKSPTLAQQRGAKAFQKIEGGPTELVLVALGRAPSGLTYSEVVEAVLPEVQTNATNPKRSIGNVLLALKKRGKVAYHDGRYYSPL